MSPPLRATLKHVDGGSVDLLHAAPGAGRLSRVLCDMHALGVWTCLSQTLPASSSLTLRG